jgi:hypothetical protein
MGPRQFATKPSLYHFTNLLINGLRVSGCQKELDWRKVSETHEEYKEEKKKKINKAHVMDFK